jgi:hypothetical protein
MDPQASALSPLILKHDHSLPTLDGGSFSGLAPLHSKSVAVQFRWADQFQWRRYHLRAVRLRYGR